MPRPSYTFHCTKETPFRRGCVVDGTSVLHSESFRSHRDGHRRCAWCDSDLGQDFERGWEKQEREEAARKAVQESKAKGRRPNRREPQAEA